MVCFPHAGTGMAGFAPWRGRLPDLDVILVQFPGRDGRRREPNCETAQEAATGVAAALAETDLGPLVLFGHSMGALVAFETARRLQAKGRPPAALVISGRRGPTLPEPLPPIGHLPDSEFLDQVRQRYGGIPESIVREAELMALLLPTLRADIRLVESVPVRQWRVA